MDKYFECVGCNIQFRVTGSKKDVIYFCPDCEDDGLEMIELRGAEGLKCRLRVLFGVWGRADVTIWGKQIG